MATTEHIQHEGIIKNLTSQQVDVLIISNSACSECHAKGSCGMAETKQKIITIPRPPKELKIGDKVMVFASLGNAFYSVFLAYILPSILIIVTIFLFIGGGNDELSSAIAALVVVFLYFFILFLLRKNISKKIKFTIENIGNS